MKLISAQIAFFSGSFINRPDLLFSGLNKKIGDVIDGMPTIINLPLDAPVEIPLVQAKSINGLYSINITRNRVDFVITPNYSLNVEPSEFYKTIKIQFEKCFKAVSEMTELFRVGLVISLFEEKNDNARTITNKYLKEQFEEGCSEIAIRINKQVLSKGTVYNNIRNIEASTVVDGEAIHPGIHITYDINNVPEQDKLISLDMFNYIIIQGASHLKPNALKELI